MKRFYTAILMSFVVSYVTNAQKFTVSGIVKEKENKQGLSFTTVSAYQLPDSVLIDGTLSDDNGKYELSLSPGKYFVEADYVGFTPLRSADFEVKNEDVILADLLLTANTQNLDELTVRAEKSSMELSLDKRVFNVGKDLANAGGNAAELLVNIPSVTIDPEGAIKLRGSGNVRILIDGKPSGLVSFKGGAGLSQLQANMIERVEVITNPSARYEAEGMAGIINIILKKDRRQGFNGSFELIGGVPTNLGVGANVNYRHKNLNFFVNYSLAYRVSPYIGNMTQRLTDESGRYFNQTTDGNVNGLNNNVRAGLDYFFSEKSILTVSYLLSRADGKRFTENNYFDYLNDKLTASSLRVQNEEEREPLSETVVSWKKSFEKKGHELNAQFRYLDHFENSKQLFTQEGYLASGAIDPSNTFDQTSDNDEFEKQYLGQIDYEKPLGKEGKFEIGARTSLRDMVNDYNVKTVSGNSENSVVSDLANYFVYKENIHAIYGIYGNKTGKIGYQIGVRGEYTDVTTILRVTDQVNPRKYGNLFPSVHLTYDLPSENAIQLSYSKRVVRPVYNDLSPFMTVSDSRSFNSGNPDLNPEFSDVVEVGHIKYFDKGSVSSSVYARNTIDNIERIRMVDENGFAFTSPQNLIGQKAIGVEFTGAYTLSKWWKADLNFNLYHASTDGSNISSQYVTQTNSWFARHTSRFELPESTKIQFRANYESAVRSAQAFNKPIYFFDLSASKDFLNKKGTVNFSVLDILNSRKNRYIITGDSFVTTGMRQFRRRQLNLTLSYRINQGQ